jgi:hypothetical protein
MTASLTIIGATPVIGQPVAARLKEGRRAIDVQAALFEHFIRIGTNDVREIYSSSIENGVLTLALSHRRDHIKIRNARIARARMHARDLRYLLKLIAPDNTDVVVQLDAIVAWLTEVRADG